MVTIYDLLEVEEDASKEEIEKAYQRLLIEYQTNPVLSEEENRQNEMILNKLKLGYEILMDDNKRKKYDTSLAKKRAEELIKSVPEKAPDKDSNVSEEEVSNSEVKKNNIAEEEYEEANKTERKVQNEAGNNSYEDIPMAKNTREKNDEDEYELTEEEQKKIRKAAQKEFNQNLKKVKKAEQEYNNAYNEAYNKYLRKMGYSVKEPWTLKRVKNTIIGLLVIIAICTLIWLLPPTRKILTNLYKENFIIKAFVDIIVAILKPIVGIFTKNG